jgi:protease-4
MKAFIKSVLATTIGMLLGLVILAVFGGALLVMIAKGFETGGSSEPIAQKSVLHLKMHGQIVDRHRPLDFDFTSASSFLEPERSLGLYEMNKAIAKKDARFSGLYLDLRDFEGGWAALNSLHKHIESFAKSGKWVYAYADRMDEKGYFLATAANQIYMQPNGEIEMNGLSVTEMFLKGLFDKLEVEPRVFRVGKFKAAVEPLIRDKMSDENRLQTQTLLDDIWTATRDEISRIMGIPAPKLDRIAAGLEVTSAAQAQQHGLVHKLLFEDQVEDLMKAKSAGKDKDLELVSVGRLLKDHSHMSFAKVGPGKKIALIFAEGEIKSGSPGRNDIGAESLREDIIDAKEDKDVAAVVLRVNSPGGDALASDIIWRELKTADDEMPVVVSMGDVAASGGYYIATAGRYIFAEPTTITGSIGVFGIMFNTERLFKTKAGVNFDRVVTHPMSDIGNSNRPMTAIEAGVIQRDVDRVYKRFLDVVQDGRGYAKREELESIAEGRVWSGVRAKQIGLIDELGGLDQAISKAAELAGLGKVAGKDYEVDVFPADQDPFSKLVEQLSGNVMSKYMDLGSLAQLRQLMNQVPPLKPGVQMRMPYDLNIR